MWGKRVIENLYVSLVVIVRDHIGTQSTQDTLTREHARHEHVIMRARRHARHIVTWAREHTRHVDTWTRKHAWQLGTRARKARDLVDSKYCFSNFSRTKKNF